MIFLSIITCMIDFFAMTSPGHFSYPDLFLLDCVYMAVRRRTPASSGTSSSLVASAASFHMDYSVFRRECCIKYSYAKFWSQINIIYMLHVALADTLHEYQEDSDCFSGLKDRSGYFICQSPFKQVVTRATANLSLLQVAFQTLHLKAGLFLLRIFSIQFLRGNSNPH